MESFLGRWSSLDVHPTGQQSGRGQEEQQEQQRQYTRHPHRQMATRTAVRAWAFVNVGRFTRSRLANCCTVMGRPGVWSGAGDGCGRLGGRGAVQVQRVHGQ